MDPGVCAGVERRAYEQNPRSLVYRKAHEVTGGPVQGIMAGRLRRSNALKEPDHVVQCVLPVHCECKKSKTAVEECTL
jgi:hypothetical protein